MADELAAVDINALTKVQFAALRKLEISEHQEVLGKSFLESIEDWENGPEGRVLGVCFVIKYQPVGLALFRGQPPPQSGTVSIHGLKIATPWQQRGFGHQAFQLAINYMKSVWPEAETLKLAVDAENIAAVAVYRAFGMRDSGPIFDGPNGKEHRMEVSLAA